MTYTSLLCQFNGGCMGCCGYCFPSKMEIREAIRRNVLEFEELKPRTAEELIRFRDRAEAFDLRNGVCRNLLVEEGNIFCPLHPKRNKERELREGHCDLNHLCWTAKQFGIWDSKKKEKFLEFIKNKNLDNIDYSLGMDEGRWFEEFEENESSQG